MKQEDDHLLSLATLGFFAFSLVHNLANQFTQLLYYVDEAQEYLPPSTQKRLRSTTQYLASVVRDSQALLVKDSACDLWFDLKPCVQEALELSEYEIRHNRVEILLQLQSAKVMGNRVVLLQILLNVLKNSLQALKHAKERKIEVSITHTSEEWILQIRDTGTGLKKSPEFLQADSAEQHGIGLAYCQHHMRQSFGGHFYLTNAPNGQGCVCELHFPRKHLATSIRQRAERPVE